VFSGDDESVRTASYNKTAKMTKVASFLVDKDLAAQTVFSGDEESVLTASFDKTAKMTKVASFVVEQPTVLEEIWNTTSGKCTQTLSEPSESVRTASYLKTAKMNRMATFVVEQPTGHEEIWDTTSGECTQTLSEPSGAELSAAASSLSPLAPVFIPTAYRDKKAEQLTSDTIKQDGQYDAVMALREKGSSERTFPLDVFENDMALQLEKAMATDDSDRVHILNLIAGAGKEFSRKNSWRFLR